MTTTQSSSIGDVERLSFAMLRDAYIDLANIVKLSKPGLQHTILRDLEENVVLALQELGRSRMGSDGLDPVTIAVGEKLDAVLREARAPLAVHLADLDERFALDLKII